MQETLFGMAGGALAFALLAGLAERRRQKRRHVAGVGWVPWSGLTVTALFVAAMCVGLGLKGGF